MTRRKRKRLSRRQARLRRLRRQHPEAVRTVPPGSPLDMTPGHRLRRIRGPERRREVRDLDRVSGLVGRMEDCLRLWGALDSVIYEMGIPVAMRDPRSER